VLLQACDNGQADVAIFDSPPAIEVVKPVNFTSATFRLKLKFYDGADPSISSSPLANATYKITTMADVTVTEGNLAVSGVFTEIDQPISGIAKGKYKLKVSATDTNGNNIQNESTFEILESVGIIGDAVAGWDADVNLQASATQPDVFVLTSFLLKTGQAKFRANDDWAINWGATTFPEGTGVQEGANIPVTPGTYDISIDVSNGKYTFVRK